ncbi:MAG: B12-binding domain-containing radical SAM protein [Pseudomonadales bacterium]|nr:B12-binding domain-containing radical SAM protein [Pseudomonadales bacterium]
MSNDLKRILLISVDYSPDAYQTSQWGMHPLGLMYVAAAAQKAFPEIEIRIYQTLTNPNYEEDLPKLLLEFQPDLIGIRALSFYRNHFRTITDLIRAHQPECPVVGGGPHSSTSYEELLRTNQIDLAVLGEGEVTFVEIIKALNNNTRIPTSRVPGALPGTAVLVEGEVIKNPERQKVDDLDQLPWPAYNLINLDDFEHINDISHLPLKNRAYMETSRGCPYKCFYCHIAAEKLLRQRTTESVVSEMRHLKDTYGITHFNFVDDIFNVPPRWAKKTLAAIAKELPGITLAFPNGLRADQLDEELLDLFEAAGTVQMALAIETVTPRLQKFIGKNLKVEKAQKIIELASPRFISTGFFMVGLPSETYAEAEQTIQFAASLTHLLDPVFNVTRIYRNSLIWDHLQPTKEQGRLIDEQTSGSTTPKLFARLDDQFYGDFFDDAAVPLKTEHVRELRTMWLREVQFNPHRIHNSYQVARRFLSHQQTVETYRSVLNDFKFTVQKLDSMLDFADRQLAKQNPPAGVIGGQAAYAS